MGSGGWGVQVRTIKYGMQLKIKNGPLFKKRIGTFGKEISQIYYEVDVKKRDLCRCSTIESAHKIQLNKVAGVVERSAGTHNCLQSIKPGTECLKADSCESTKERQTTNEYPCVSLIPHQYKKPISIIVYLCKINPKTNTQSQLSYPCLSTQGWG